MVIWCGSVVDYHRYSRIVRTARSAGVLVDKSWSTKRGRLAASAVCLDARVWGIEWRTIFRGVDITPVRSFEPKQRTRMKRKRDEPENAKLERTKIRVSRMRYLRRNIVVLIHTIYNNIERYKAINVTSSFLIDQLGLSTQFVARVGRCGKMAYSTQKSGTSDVEIPQALFLYNFRRN